jgi:hypothetical protein
LEFWAASREDEKVGPQNTLRTVRDNKFIGGIQDILKKLEKPKLDSTTCVLEMERPTNSGLEGGKVIRTNLAESRNYGEDNTPQACL